MALEIKKPHTILQSESLLEYILDKSVSREHEQLQELRKATYDNYDHRRFMSTNVDEAQLIAMILKIMNAKKTIEIGVFTGYSALATALALPDDGQIIAIDPDKEAYEFGLPFIKKAGVEHKIQFIASDAMTILNEYLDSGKEGSFDFAYVDGDKDNYINYHEKMLKLVKVGGIIGYDNTLWFGYVTLPEENELNEYMRNGREVFLKFNAFIASDPRVEVCLASIGDGITLCRRLY